MDGKTYEDGLRDGRVSALEEEVSDIKKDIQGMTDSLRNEFCRRIDPISRALLGNGSPQDGLISRFTAVANIASTNRWLIGIVLVAMIGLAIKVIAF